MTLSLGSISKRESAKVLCVATGCRDKGFPPRDCCLRFLSDSLDFSRKEKGYLEVWMFKDHIPTSWDAQSSDIREHPQS